MCTRLNYTQLQNTHVFTKHTLQTLVISPADQDESEPAEHQGGKRSPEAAAPACVRAGEPGAHAGHARGGAAEE